MRSFRAWVDAAKDKLFPPNASFLLGEIALGSFVGLVASGIYLALFYSPSLAPTAYHGLDRSLEGRLVPAAFESVMHVSLEVPFGLVVRRFHHFAAHLFIASIVLHAARVFFTGAFRRPREITWWLGLTLLALALLNGFTGYVLPFDMRGGAALRQLLTTLETVPWVGAWLATLAFGASFPGPFILGRLYVEHVFLGPVLIALVIAAHLFFVVRLTHTQYRGPGRTETIEVGSPAWPDQAARSSSLILLVFGWIALLSAFLPVESVWIDGPYQSLSYYAPLHPDWFLLFVEGAWHLLPGRLDFHWLGANFTVPFFGATVFSLALFGGLAAYPLVERRFARDPGAYHHLLDDWRQRPFRTAFGSAGLFFLALVSVAAIDDRIAALAGISLERTRLTWGLATVFAPSALFAIVFFVLRARMGRGRS